VLGGCAGVGRPENPVADPVLRRSSPDPDAEWLQPSRKPSARARDKLEIEIAGDPASRAATLVGRTARSIIRCCCSMCGQTLAQAREQLEHALAIFTGGPRVSSPARSGQQAVWLLGRLTRRVNPSRTTTLLERLRARAAGAHAGVRTLTSWHGDLRGGR